MPPPTLLAHRSGIASPDELWSTWNWQPLLLLSLVLLGWAYIRGVVLMRRRSGRRLPDQVRLRAVAFACGILTLAVALVSPLDPLSAELAWVHMVQHMLLMVVAAPLVMFGAPLRVMPRALPRGWRRAFGQFCRILGSASRMPGYLLWRPLLLWMLYAVTLWLWHVPATYEAALNNTLLHDVQHVTFFVTACLFWRLAIDPVGILRASRTPGVVYLFTTSLHASALGAFMALSPDPWYPSYEGRTEAWHLTALEDQQLAGAIMWMPSCLVYAIVAAILFGVWLQTLSKEMPTRGVAAAGRRASFRQQT